MVPAYYTIGCSFDNVNLSVYNFNVCIMNFFWYCESGVHHDIDIYVMKYFFFVPFSEQKENVKKNALFLFSVVAGQAGWYLLGLHLQQPLLTAFLLLHLAINY